MYVRRVDYKSIVHFQKNYMKYLKKKRGNKPLFLFTFQLSLLRLYNEIVRGSDCVDDIVKQKTRLIFDDYTDNERRYIENLSSTMDNVFIYLNEEKRRICLPTGMEKSIGKLFPKHRIIDQSNDYWDYDRIPIIEHPMKPRNQLQEDFISYALDKISKQQKIGGILSVGTGKTFMACYCAIAARLKTLIIAPTSSIRQQWADTLTDMFKIDPSKVLIARTPEDFIHRTKDAWFIITIHPTLASLNKRYDMEEVLRNCKFGFKVIDEVQMWFQNIINIDGCCNIPNNLYLTGTFGRSGEAENNLYQEMFGDINIFREKQKEPTFWNRKPGNIYGMKPHTICKMFWGHSHLTKEELQKVTNKWRYSERSDKWTRIGIGIATYSKLIFPEDGTVTPFMKQLIKVIRRAFKECDYGKTLILMPSIASAEMFKSIMKEMYPDLTVGTIHSYNSFAENTNNKKTCDCLVSTPQSAGTGFDYKGLSRLIVAAQYSSWILTSQIRGRCRVRDDGRPTYMYDMVDADIPQLRRWANKRAAILRKECLEFKVIDIDV